MSFEKLPPDYQEIFDFLSEINQKAYRDINLVSNEVLTKNPFVSPFVSRCLAKDFDCSISLLFVAKRLMRYFLKALRDYFLYIFTYVLFRQARGYGNSSREYAVVIDTYFIVDRILENGRFDDTYFLGLNATLDKNNISYAYLATFYHSKNPLKLLKVYRSLTAQKCNFMCEYSLLSFIDLIRLFIFIFRYPYSVLKLVASLDKNDKKENLLAFELVESLDFVVTDRYARYLSGRRIGKSALNNLKLISWYENQAIDKNLYAGIKSVESPKVVICGAQLLVFSNTMLNLIPDKNEISFGLVPDVVVVNSQYQLYADIGVPCCIGPSMRYRKVYETDVYPLGSKKLLVLLSYLESDTRYLLKVLDEVKDIVSDCEIHIRPHPATPLNLFVDLLPEKYTIADGDLYEHFKDTRIVLGTASGSLVESVAVGMPTICVENPSNGFLYRYLPENSKSRIYAVIHSSGELSEALRHFEVAIQNNYNLLEQEAQVFRERMFSRVSDDKILSAFGLKQ